MRLRLSGRLLGACALAMIPVSVWATDPASPGHGNVLAAQSPLPVRTDASTPRQMVPAQNCRESGRAAIRTAQVTCPPGTCPCRLGGCSPNCC